MKLILTSDLHQRIEKWQDLVDAVKAERPRFVLIAGDLLPKLTNFNGQKKFFGQMRRYFQAMQEAGPVTVLTYFGNDDAHILEPLLDELEAEGLCVNLNGRVHREEGLVFCGMNKVRDYPFGYKHWCARDGDYVACPEQFCGQGLTMDEHGDFLPLKNLVEYLFAKPSIGEELHRLKEQLRPDEMARSIWMVHQPPTGLGMDICGGGRQVGSPTVFKFIADNQPLLGCSGHIHESPYQPGGQWIAQVGRTTWVQPGQMGHRLHCVCLEISDTLSVTNIRHSTFGTLST
jgi:Icc-related predicted phosphoesterase